MLLSLEYGTVDPSHLSQAWRGPLKLAFLPTQWSQVAPNSSSPTASTLPSCLTGGALTSAFCVGEAFACPACSPSSLALHRRLQWLSPTLQALNWAIRLPSTAEPGLAVSKVYFSTVALAPMIHF